MKELPNKVFVKTRADGKHETVARLIGDCLKTMPQTGFDFALMRARQRVDDVISAAEDGGIIKLEDADFAVALEAIKATRWVAREPHLIEFADLLGV